MSKNADSENSRDVEIHPLKPFSLEFPTDTVFSWDSENDYITLMIAQQLYKNEFNFKRSKVVILWEKKIFKNMSFCIQF